jgi:putative MATE family efflux protein
VLLSAGLGVIFGALGVVFSPRLLAAMGGEGETLRLGSEYLRRIYAGFPLMSLAMVGDGIFIGMGDTRTPFRLQLGGVFLNAALSAFSILVLGVGIGGIALASVTTRGLVGATGMALLVGRLGRRVQDPHASAWNRLRQRLPGLRQLRPQPGLWREIVRVGLPVAASVSFYSGIFMTLNKVLSQFGQQAFGVIGIGIRGNESIGFMVLVGFGAAASALTGEALGRESRRDGLRPAGELSRHLRASVMRVLLACLPLALVFSLLWTLIPELLCSIYTNDPELIRLSAMYLRLAAVANLFQVMELILSEGMTGAGISSYPLWISVPGNLARIPLAFFLVAHTNWGINAVWAAILISCALKGTGMLLLFLGTDWPEQAARRTRELGRRVAASRG